MQADTDSVCSCEDLDETQISNGSSAAALPKTKTKRRKRKQGRKDACHEHQVLTKTPLCEESVKETPVCEEEAARHLFNDAEVSRTVGIRLGCSTMGNQQQLKTIQQFVAGATQALVARGFSFASPGINIEMQASGGQRSYMNLVFPCAMSARAAYLLFNEYHGKSGDGCQCVVVELQNEVFQKELSALDPNVRNRFFNPSEVTPTNVQQNFH